MKATISITPADQNAEIEPVPTSGSLSADEWANVKRLQAILPAGQVTPSPKPYAAGGRPEQVIAEIDWTPAMRIVVDFAQRFAVELIGVEIAVRIVREPQVTWSANYGGRSLCLNLGTLGHRWFDEFPQSLEPVVDLLIHELAHEYESDHLSRQYYKALTRLGAKAVQLALTQPQLYRPPQ